MLSEFFMNFTLQGTQQWPEPQFLNRMLKQKMKKRLKATPHNSKCRYGERGAADAKPKAQIILDCLIEHFGNADAVPQPPERCLSRKAGIVRCCLNKRRKYYMKA